MQKNAKILFNTGENEKILFNTGENEKIPGILRK